MNEGANRGIVVGVDGSEHSADALRWAMRQAEHTGAEVRALRAWQLPASYGYPGTWVDIDFEEEARKDLQRVVDDVSADHPGVAVTAEVVRGHPADVLVTASKGAGLLVVGSHGHGAFAGMLLGSVSVHCTHNAHCPVIVVRIPTTDRIGPTR